jgi:hypothetical protein
VSFRTIHDVNLGIDRLLEAPKDIVSGVTYPDKQPTLQKADPAYRSLFKTYLLDFDEVFEEVTDSWESDIDELIDGGNTLEEAIQTKIELCAAGPAEDPFVIWLVRKYWLACDSIGKDLDPSVRVRPEIFLLRWLLDEGRDNFVQLLTAMPYWPIGLDEDGNWC